MLEVTIALWLSDDALLSLLQSIEMYKNKIHLANIVVLLIMLMCFIIRFENIYYCKEIHWRELYTHLSTLPSLLEGSDIVDVFGVM